MSRYIPIAIIRIEHTYYDSFMNRNVILEPTSDTRKLMRQRGVMFVPTGTNEWQWAMPDDAPGFMDDDVLEVSMRVKDPYFLQQIESKGYEPGSLYLFSIENGVVEVNADYVWKKETEEQRLKNEFCRMKLEPVKSAPERLQRLHTKMEQLEKEGDGKETGKRLEAVKQEIKELQEICCPKFTLRFSSPAYYWEYLCIFKDENDMRGEKLSLRTSGDKVAFGLPEKYEKKELGTNVWRIVSTERIMLKKQYQVPFLLYIGTRVESRFISPPQPGKFLSDSPHTLREICYINGQ